MTRVAPAASPAVPPAVPPPDALPDALPVTTPGMSSPGPGGGAGTDRRDQEHGQGHGQGNGHGPGPGRHPGPASRIPGRRPRFGPAPDPALRGMIGLSGRMLFAAQLAGYFWASALTKIDGAGPSLGAYAQILPRRMEAAGYDIAALGPVDHAVVGAGTLAEFLLPLLLVAGLFTRIAALGMIGFIAVMTLTDILGHGVDARAIGAPFDRVPDAPIADQRLAWTWLLAVLAATGGGYLSLDRLIGWRIGRAPRAQHGARSTRNGAHETGDDTRRTGTNGNGPERGRGGSRGPAGAPSDQGAGTMTGTMTGTVADTGADTGADTAPGDGIGGRIGGCPTPAGEIPAPQGGMHGPPGARAGRAGRQNR